MLASDILLRIAADLEFEPFVIGHNGGPPLDDKQRLTLDQFRGYQHRCKDLIKSCVIGEKPLPGLLLALEPGAGKTGITLAAVRELIDGGHIKRVLIVASVLVAQTVWPAEIDEWEELRNTTHTLIRVEDDDPELLAVSEAAYAEAYAMWQARFDADVADEPVLKPTQARAAVRFRWLEAAKARQTADEIERKAKPKSSPSELADLDRNAAVLKFKYEKLARLASEDTEVHIINKEALPWLWQHSKAQRSWAYDLIVCDDLREGRGAKKRVARAKGTTPPGKAAPLSRFGVLAIARKHCKATIQLTGTPTPKGLENIWGLAYLIDLGERLGLSKHKFLEKWFTSNEYTREVLPNGMKRDEKTKMVIEDGWAFGEVMAAVKDIMFSIDPKDIGQLPDLIIDPIRIKLPAKVLAEYRQFERSGCSDIYDVEAVNGGVLHNKLLQFANGSMYQEDHEDVWIHDAKIEALGELLDRLNGTPLLVAYTFEFDVSRICKRFPYARVLKPENAVETTRMWNKDQLPLVLAHRASAGHGLNMQKGTGHMCEYGLTTDVELFYQFSKRLHRPGRKLSVINHVLIAEGTIDEKVYPMYLDPRIETQNRILNAIRLAD